MVRYSFLVFLGGTVLSGRLGGWIFTHYFCLLPWQIAVATRFLLSAKGGYWGT